MTLPRTVLVSIAAVLLLGGAVGRAQDPCPSRRVLQLQLRVVPVPDADQSYTCWKPYPGEKGVWMRNYFVFNQKSSDFDQHIVIWDDTDPKHCYCYNPKTKKYWGRWVYTQPGNANAYKFSKAVAAQVGDTPQMLKFLPPVRGATAPGTETAMLPPAGDLPPVR